MKSDRRHELQTNELADGMGHWIERARPHFKTVAAGLVAAVALVCAYLFLTHQSQTREAEGWDEYFAATSANKTEDIQDLINRRPGTAAAQFARLRLADGYLAEGAELLFSDREQAGDKLRLALENYQAVKEEAPRKSQLQQRAILGLARTREARNEADEARREYKALIEIDGQSALALAAQQRLEDLERSSTREFLDWFASQDPKARGGSGIGKRPDFDFQSLPDEPLSDGAAGNGSPTGSSFEKALGGEKPAQDGSTPAEQANGAAGDAATPDAAPDEAAAPDATPSDAQQDASGS